MDSNFDTPVANEEILTSDETENTVAAEAVAKRVGFGQVLLGMFIPKKGDHWISILRKIVAILAALALLGSLGYLFYDMWLVPVVNEQKNDDIRDIYHGTKPLPPEVEPSFFPEGILDKFKGLYFANPDTRGWLTIQSSSPYWYGVDYVVAQGHDNNKYLYRDFLTDTYNKNGTLFFDYRNGFAQPDSKNKVSIIYGHNMNSGQMLASLNQLVNNLGMARSVPTIQMDTLFEEAEWKIFSVFNWDNQHPDFNYMRILFADDADFMDHVAQIRDRSWYDYQDVDVLPTDELLLLSTCSNTSQTHMSDGRTIVVARKVREGESNKVNTLLTVPNEDALHPKVWYEKEGLPLPPYYGGTGQTTTTASGDGTTTLPSDGTTTTLTGDGTTTTTGDGTTTPTEQTDTTADSGDETTTTTESEGTSTTEGEGTTTTESEGTSTTESEGTTTTEGDTTTTAETTTTTEGEGTSTTENEATTTAETTATTVVNGDE